MKQPFNKLKRMVCIRSIMISKNFDVEIAEIIRHNTIIKVYDIERTLVDLLRPRYDMDYEQLMPALKRYAPYEKRILINYFDMLNFLV